MGKTAGGAGRAPRGTAGVPAAIASVENQIRNGTTERLYVFSQNGTLLGEQQGGETNVQSIPNSENAIVTHNHPVNPSAYDYPPSLSVGDINTALSQGVAEIRAVGEGYTYSMKFDPAIRSDRRWANDFQARIAEVRLDVGDSLRERGVSRTQFRAEIDHLTWEQMAKEYPQIQYKRTRVR